MIDYKLFWVDNERKLLTYNSIGGNNFTLRLGDLLGSNLSNAPAGWFDENGYLRSNISGITLGSLTKTDEMVAFTKSSETLGIPMHLSRRIFWGFYGESKTIIGSQMVLLKPRDKLLIEFSYGIDYNLELQIQ